MNKKYKYDVAISFAEEDRNAALALALALELKGNSKVYYYPDNLEVTAGKKIREILPEIYTFQAEYAVVLLSDVYLTKTIAQLELKAIHKRMLQESDIVYLIIIKLDEHASLAHNPDMDELIYLKWDYKPKDIADIILEKLGEPNISDKDQKLPDPKSDDNTNNIIMKNEAIGTIGGQSNTLTVNYGKHGR